MSQKKVYDIQKDGLVVFEVKPNLDELEKEKKRFIEKKQGNLMYEIFCGESPSWLESNNFSIPYSQLDRVGNIFSRSESVLTPITKISNAQQSLLSVYVKNDLPSSSVLKTVYDDKTKTVMYYFLFLTEKYTSKYKTNYHGNILSLNRELFMYETICQGLYELLDDEELKDVNKFFKLVSCGEFSYKELRTFLDNDLYNALMERAKSTSRLVKKING